MTGKAPSAWFIAAVAAVGVCVLAGDAVLAMETITEGVMVLVGLVTVIAVIGRTAVAFSPPRRDAKAWAVRTGAPAFLTVAVIAVLAIFPPGEVRMALSRDDLDAYARTVGESGRCDEPRWVGFYKVTCAERDGDVVRLAIDEPLAPTNGVPWLTGPGDWSTWIMD